MENKESELLPPPSYREIPLTRGKVAIVDAEDYDRVMQHKWHVQIYPTTCRARNSNNVYMHRLILNAMPHETIDHRDGDALNNRKSNLRRATLAGNNQNARIRKDNSSGFKGVQIASGNGKRTGKWKATIRFNGKTLHLGIFERAEDAAYAYDQRARELFGEFAHLNFPGLAHEKR